MRRTRKEIEDELQESLEKYPSVIDSVKLDLILEVLLDIRELLRLIKAQVKVASR